jgi:hypothetical protein
MNRRRLILTAALALAPMAPSPSWSLPAAEPPGLRPDVIEKLLKLIANLGVDTSLPASIATALNLDAAGQDWPDRQLAVRSQLDGALHAVAANRGDKPDLIFSVSGPAAISVLRTDRTGSLIAATAYFAETHLTAALLHQQALTALAAEGAFWRSHVDALMNPP